ncbi:MAG: polysaccharide lyase family 1 protein [Anaerolineae bacterium]
MREQLRITRAAWVLLGITLLLWLMALLFSLRVVNIFDRYLMKFPGPVVTFGFMLLAPLAVLLIGAQMIHRRQNRAQGWFLASAGGLLIVTFAAVIAAPMIADAFAPRPPENPSTPRPLELQAGLPVFPGAEGFGTRTVAGRGGKVIEVTSLADSGPGTLRAAVEDPSPRTVVFRVGGTIELESEIQIGHPFITVAGQTAPGGGICLRNAGIAVSTHDVLIQHLRVRPGNEGDVDADINDAISILGPRGGEGGAYNVVIDHVSASWSEDEAVSTWYGAHDVTISWSIISEALNRSRHRKRTHSAGLLIGDSSYNVSVHHNLLAHNDFRNPLIFEGGTHDIVYNVIYNWGVLPAEIVDLGANTFVNLIGNIFVPGPSTPPDSDFLVIVGEPSICAEGNFILKRSQVSFQEWALFGPGIRPVATPSDEYGSDTRFMTPPVTALDAAQLFGVVLDHAGATAPQRDTTDARIVTDVVRRRGAIIDSPSDVGGYPHLAAGQPLDDSDHDGMPDVWEWSLGLDLSDPADGSGDRDGDGYTNLEEYLHWIAEPAARE